MSYQNQLLIEINDHLDKRAARNEPWVAKWIAHGICAAHSDGLVSSGDDADFFRHCAYIETRDQVTRVINRRAGDQKELDQGQLKLPGYAHLQSYYVVKRDGEEIGLPVFDLTDEELEEKASVYRKMARACHAHADELDRFRRLREHSDFAVAAE